MVLEQRSVGFVWHREMGVLGVRWPVVAGQFRIRCRARSYWWEVFCYLRGALKPLLVEQLDEAAHGGHTDTHTALWKCGEESSVSGSRWSIPADTKLPSHGK